MSRAATADRGVVEKVGPKRETQVKDSGFIYGEWTETTTIYNSSTVTPVAIPPRIPHSARVHSSEKVTTPKTRFHSVISPRDDVPDSRLLVTQKHTQLSRQPLVAKPITTH